MIRARPAPYFTASRAPADRARRQFHLSDQTPGEPAARAHSSVQETGAAPPFAGARDGRLHIGGGRTAARAPVSCCSPAHCYLRPAGRMIKRPIMSFVAGARAAAEPLLSGPAAYRPAACPPLPEPEPAPPNDARRLRKIKGPNYIWPTAAAAAAAATCQPRPRAESALSFMVRLNASRRAGKKSHPAGPSICSAAVSGRRRRAYRAQLAGRHFIRAPRANYDCAIHPRPADKRAAGGRLA